MQEILVLVPLESSTGGRVAGRGDLITYTAYVEQASPVGQPCSLKRYYLLEQDILVPEDAVCFFDSQTPGSSIFIVRPLPTTLPATGKLTLFCPWTEKVKEVPWQTIANCDQRLPKSAQDLLPHLTRAVFQIHPDGRLEMIEYHK